MVNKQTQTNQGDSTDKEAALFFLATSTDYAAAALQIRCSLEQIYIWLREPEFKSKLDSLRSEIVQDSICKMKTHTRKAVDVIADCMGDPDPQIRLRAANDVLSRVSKFIELREVECRLTQLEKQLKLQSRDKL